MDQQETDDRSKGEVLFVLHNGGPHEWAIAPRDEEEVWVGVFPLTEAQADEVREYDSPKGIMGDLLNGPYTVLFPEEIETNP